MDGGGTCCSPKFTGLKLNDCLHQCSKAPTLCQFSDLAGGPAFIPGHRPTFLRGLQKVEGVTPTRGGRRGFFRCMPTARVTSLKSPGRGVSFLFFL